MSLKMNFNVRNNSPLPNVKFGWRDMRKKSGNCSLQPPLQPSRPLQPGRKNAKIPEVAKVNNYQKCKYIYLLININLLVLFKTHSIFCLFKKKSFFFATIK
jgi:hypothetical protein